MLVLKIAILDMYAGVANEGMRCIHQLIERTQVTLSHEFAVEVFDVRGLNQLPDLSYDVYISSGGPGSPLPSSEDWEAPYFGLFDQLLAWNRTQVRKKHVLLICHSFQLISRHLGIGTLSKRKSTSFGVLPMHKTEAGESEPLLAGLPEPFFAVDSRDYQVTYPDFDHLEEIGAQVVCLEKKRPHVPLARALMAVRFTPEIFGTQFHPEADGDGMLRYLLTDEKKQQVITNHGEAKYHEMVAMLRNPDTIELTESVIVPNFLRQAASQVGVASAVPLQAAVCSLALATD
jgi:homoserine O-succinyltransferase/O-acetyltransferase